MTTCTALIHIDDIDTYSKIALGGDNGAAEAYIEGLWQTDDLVKLIRILVNNRALTESMGNSVSRISAWLLKGWHYLNKNSKAGSKKNIAAHYDLGNEFFKLFLDKRMMYSSYLYEKGDNLHKASERKLARICEQLDIQTDDHVVEIGTGWGGFACYAAEKTGCKVTTITISQEQYNEAVALVKRKGLQDQVTVSLKDYRDLTGQFDKLVSIEMIEAVGHHYLGTYFERINQLLKPKGTALIQAIVIEDGRYKKALKKVDFIKQYIFPGGFLPSNSVITQHAANNTLKLDDMYDMGQSYAQTLADWRELFMAKLSEVRAQGFDDRFIRMWEFYLCYCEGAFREQTISVGQLKFRKHERY